MAPPSFPHGEHPDGDPFAERDAAAMKNTALGRLEARALAEQAQTERTTTPTRSAVVAPPTRSTRANPNFHSSITTASPLPAAAKSNKITSGNKTETNLTEVVILGDTSDEEPKTNTTMAITGSAARKPILQKKAPVSTSNGLPTRKRAREEEDSNLLSSTQIQPENQISEQPSQKLRQESPKQFQQENSTTPKISAEMNRNESTSLSPIDERKSASISPQQSAAEPKPSTAAESTTTPSAILTTMTSPLSEPNTLPAQTSPLAVPVKLPNSAQISTSNSEPTPAQTSVAPPTNAAVTASPAPAPAAARTREPSREQVPKPKAGPKTVRLTIQLPARIVGRPTEAPEFSIAQMASEAGFDQRTEPAASEDDDSDADENDVSSESDGEGGRRKKIRPDVEMKDGTQKPISVAGPAPKQRKRAPNVVLGRFGGYDDEDPFVDDSEIDLYEPSLYVLPKRSGFFVAMGEVELETKRRGGGGGGGGTRSAANKPRPGFDEGGNLNSAAGFAIPSNSDAGAGSGTDTTPRTNFPLHGVPLQQILPAPTAMPSFGNAAQALPPLVTQSAAAAAAAAQAAAQAKKLTKKRNPGEFSAETKLMMEEVKKEATKHSFIPRNKFPPALKPMLVDLGWCAFQHDELDEDFYATVHPIFPYNRYTITKLIKVQMYPKKMAYWKNLQDEQLKILRLGVEENLVKQKQEFEKLHLEWKMKTAQTAQPSKQVETQTADRELQTPPPQPGFSAISASVGSGTSPAPGAATGEVGEVPEPKWKFRFTEEMRQALCNACDYGDEMSNLTIEKQELERKDGQIQGKPHSAMNDRKELYTTINKLFPQGDMTTNQISREMTAHRNKLTRRAIANA